MTTSKKYTVERQYVQYYLAVSEVDAEDITEAMKKAEKLEITDFELFPDEFLRASEYNEVYPLEYFDENPN